MCQRSVFSRSCSRIAEEVQLQAEAEFMMEALKKIKQQRNCLQIERLHLESLRQQLQSPVNNADNEQQSVEQGGSSNQFKAPANPSTKPTKLMSAVDMMSMGSMQHKNVPSFMDDDIQCNNQELNLNPTSSSGYDTFQPPYTQYGYNSDDGSSSDASDGDNVVIDMNMLMHGSIPRN